MKINGLVILLVNTPIVTCIKRKKNLLLLIYIRMFLYKYINVLDILELIFILLTILNKIVTLSAYVLTADIYQT